MRLALNLCATLLALLALAAPARAQKPNVVVIMTDDQPGESMRVMPRTNALIAGKGVAFPRSYASYPLCCPARATFLTGQYSHNHGVRSNTPPTGGYGMFANQQTTMPVALQQAGYRTIHIGKYLNGYGSERPSEIPPGWTDWNGGIDPSTYRMYSYSLSINGTPTPFPTMAQDPTSYQTDVFHRMAVEKIRREATQPGPFFMTVAPLAPHAESNREVESDTIRAAPRHEGRYANEPMARPPSFNEADVSDKPQFIRQRSQFGPLVLQRVEETYRNRLEALLSVDEMVEGITRALEATGQLKNTVLVFTTDHGFFQGEHRVASGKVLGYEPAARVPLYIRGPGIERGKLSPELVANIDLAPTILDYAGARALRAPDGKSLRPLLEDTGVRLGRDVLLTSGPNDDNLPVYRGIHTGRWKYVEWPNGDRELYDLAADPHELQSRHADPGTATLRGLLAARLAKLAACGGRACQAVPKVSNRFSFRRGSRGCVRSKLRFKARGDRIARVVISYKGRKLATDSRSPFGRTVSTRRLPRGKLASLRATVEFEDGRARTLDKRLRRCR